jgi:hypothetical protein
VDGRPRQTSGPASAAAPEGRPDPTPAVHSCGGKPNVEPWSKPGVIIMLEELFAKQAELNRRNGFDPDKLRRSFDPQLAGQWLHNYLMAMSNELEELRDCTYWKHWVREAKEGRRYFLHDLQNARVEVIDLLFFWISLAQCVGLNAQDVMDLYNQKLAVNHARQDQNYSMSDKTEDDNKGISLDRQ